MCVRDTIPSPAWTIWFAFFYLLFFFSFSVGFYLLGGKKASRYLALGSSVGWAVAIAVYSGIYLVYSWQIASSVDSP